MLTADPLTGDQVDVSVRACRAIVRCTRKGCRQAVRAEFATTLTVRAYEGRPAGRRTVRWAGTDRAYRDAADLARIVCAGFACAACGGRGWEFAIVSGRVAEAVKCGARCRAAVGPSCDCQCGGERHGEAHAPWPA